MTSDNSSFSELGELSLTPEQLIQIKSEVDYRLYQEPSRFSALILEVSSELGLSPSAGDLDLLFRKYLMSLARLKSSAETLHKRASPEHQRRTRLRLQANDCLAQISKSLSKVDFNSSQIQDVLSLLGICLERTGSPPLKRGEPETW